MDALEETRRQLAYVRIMGEDMLKVQRVGSFAFIVWGIATLLAVGLTYLLTNVGLGSYTTTAWMVSMYGALALSALYAKRRSFSLSPLSARILNHVWWSVSLTVFFLPLVIGAAIRLNQAWVIYFAVVQILIAIGVFITGGIYMLPALKKIGVLQWICALPTAAFLPRTWVPLEFGILVGGGLLLASFLTRIPTSNKPEPAEDGEELA